MALGGANKEQGGALSEINVTPLVDVMLVLLIIFMIVAPKLISGVNVNLPKVDTAPAKIDAGEVVISISAQGEFYVGKDKVTLDALSTEVRSQLAEKGKNKVYLKADANVKYGVVAQTIAQIKASGITNVGLITEPPDKDKKPPR